MKPPRLAALFAAAAALLMHVCVPPDARADHYTSDGYLELYQNLERAVFDGDRLSGDDWDAQSFDSETATVLRHITLNLYRADDAHSSGIFWVKLYDASGPSGSPGTNAVAVIEASRPIPSLHEDANDFVGFWSLSVPLTPHTRYYIVVGTHSGASGLRWGFTNDPVGAVGFPSIFTFTSNAGVTWRTPFTSALPQRMRVLALDP